MNISHIRIGYVPYSKDLSQPADRRRFPYFAKRMNLPYEIADVSKDYHLIILPAPANLSKWLIYKRKHPNVLFIFEMVDSLIFTSDFFLRICKGTARFLLGKDTLLYPDYRRLIIKWVQIADVVMCSSQELKSNLLKWNKNVIVSLDYLESEYSIRKEDYSIENKMKLVWEGQGSVLLHFLHFKEVFSQLNSFCELHIITTEKYSKYGQIMKRKVSRILDQLPIKTVFHKWDIETNNKILSQADCGIIPLNRNNNFAWHKPANKLISFWFTGLPGVVSNTPAYTDLMQGSGDHLYCAGIESWTKNIHEVRNMSEIERRELAQKNLAYVQEYFSDEVLDLVWKSAFEHFGFS